MGRRGRDHEAEAGAETGSQPANIEEQKRATGVSAPIAAAPIAAAPSGYCKTCSPRPAVPDPKGLHECARCRMVLLPEVAERRATERAAAKKKLAAAAK